MGCCENNETFSIYDRNGVPFVKRSAVNGSVGYYAPFDEPVDYSLSRDNKTFLDRTSIQVPLYSFSLTGNTVLRPVELMFDYVSQPVSGLSVAEISIFSNGIYSGSSTSDILVSLERSINFGGWVTVDRFLMKNALDIYKLSDFVTEFVNDGNIFQISWRVSFLSATNATVSFGDCSIDWVGIIRNSESTL